MSKSLHFLLTRVFNTPLLIHPQKLNAILSVIQPRIAGAKLEEIDSEIHAPAAVEVGGRSGGGEILPPEGEIAIIPVYGSLVQRSNGLDAMSGLTSYTSVERALNEALDDPHVSAILFDVDSCGGEAAGCFELVDRIYEARERKPIFGLANEQAFSGGYAILSACETIWAPRTSNVGSIGVVSTHLDYSGAMEQEGIVVTHIYAGKKKVDGSPYKPLSPGAHKDFQAEINTIYDVFAESVARNRGLSVAAVRATEAGTFVGKSAVNAGLVDEIISLADLPAKLQETMMKKRNQQAGLTAPKGAPALETEDETLLEAPAVEGDDEEEDEDEKPFGKKKAKSKSKKSRAQEEDEDGEDDEDEDEPAGKKKKKAAKVVAIRRASVRQEAAAIIEMCSAARQPGLAANFVKRGLSLQQAKAELFDKMAAGDMPSISAVDPMRSGESTGEELLVKAMRSLNESKSKTR